MGGIVVVAFDATKDHRNNANDFDHIIHGMMMSSVGMLSRGDSILVFGVLHKVSHPFGYQMQIEDANIHAMEEDVSKKLDMYVKMLQRSAEDCKHKGVDIEVKITCGTPLRKIIQQEATTCSATWLVLDRHLRRDMQFYQGHTICKLAVMLDDLTMKPVETDPASYLDDDTEVKVILFRSKPVLHSAPQENENVERSIFSGSSYFAPFGSFDILEMPLKKIFSSFMHKSLGHNTVSTDLIVAKTMQDTSVGISGGGSKSGDPSLTVGKEQKSPTRKRSPNPLVICTVCGMTTKLYIKESMRYTYSEIHFATSSFSDENLLGEGGFGEVYKGQLNDGQIIAAKVRKAASVQGFAEFRSEIYVLSFARHRNIVILLGYCCKEDVNILVYEYICNRSLEWHLFSKQRIWLVF